MAVNKEVNICLMFQALCERGQLATVTECGFETKILTGYLYLPDADVINFTLWEPLSSLVLVDNVCTYLNWISHTSL